MVPSHGMTAHGKQGWGRRVGFPRDVKPVACDFTCGTADLIGINHDKYKCRVRTNAQCMLTKGSSVAESYLR